MGYEVHITRADEWSDSEASPIALDEWIRYVDADDEMRLDGHADADLGDAGVLRYESAGLAVWTAYSGDGRDGNRAWFDHCDGRVDVKNPDEEILAKVVRIARALSARVVGDDGETYGDDSSGPAASAPEPKPPWWKRILSGADPR